MNGAHTEHLYVKYEKTFTVKDWNELHMEIGNPLTEIFRCRTKKHAPERSKYI